MSNNYKEIKLADLVPNEGQLDGLPANPRQISEEKFELLKRNIEAYPEMLALRGLMVYPMPDGKYLVVGGNMRLRAMQELGHTAAPCVVIPADTDTERLKAYTIIDNNGFGKWDWDMIANEWDTDAVTGWGLDLPVMGEDIDVQEFFNEEVGKSKDGSEKLTVTIPKELADQKDEIADAVTAALAGYTGVTVK